MNYIIDYWYIVIGFLCLGVVIGVKAYNFFQAPSNEQKENVRSWLLGIVTEAEKKFGSGTGKLKLSWVYDAFLTKFPWLATVISFDIFTTLVDSALIEMRAMLSQNKAVQEYVGGTENSEVRRLTNTN